MAEPAKTLEAANVKQCCSAFYGSHLATLLLGNNFHPGGQALTCEIGRQLGLGPGCTVLDVASGRGESALALARAFDCYVVGVDLSEENNRLATDAATAASLSSRVRFGTGDAESLPFADDSFDAILCECAFCTFPDKTTAAAEFHRVLRPGGRLALSDLTRDSESSEELDSLLAWIACIGDAQPIQRYATWLSNAGFNVEAAYERDECLHEMLEKVRGRLLLADIMVNLRKLDLPDFDPLKVKQFLTTAERAIQKHELGYAVLISKKQLLGDGGTCSRTIRGSATGK